MSDKLGPGYILSDGRYKLVELKGEGGYGVVYKATDRILGHEVAIKVLHKANTEVENFSRAYFFMREAKNLANLAVHPHIVPIFNIGVSLLSGYEHDPLIYLALEYLQGGNASQFIGITNMNIILELSLAVCDGLSHAHKRDVIHRDIKPANILLNKDKIAKVSDFGLSKKLEKINQKGSNPTVTMIGTPGYMAPEQFKTEEPTKKTDIYQFGTTFYHILTGYYAGFCDDNRIESLMKKQDKPDKLNSNIPIGFSDLIMRTLEEKPDSRPESFDSIKEILQKELDKLTNRKVIYSDPITNIRVILKEKIEQLVKQLVSVMNNLPSVTVFEDGKKCYATVLLRPFIYSSNGANYKQPMDKFVPIHFTEYTGGPTIPTAQSNWVEKPQLINKPLPIDDCCAGLPIRWYKHKIEWSQKYKDNFYFCKLKDSNRTYIEYFVLYDMVKARFDDDYKPNIVSEHYSTADPNSNWTRGVGWNLTDSSGKPVIMSQSIETEMIIPLYNSLIDENEQRCENDILGVINLEWEKSFNPDERRGIGRALSGHVLSNRQFSLTDFTCQVLYNIINTDQI